MQSSRRDFLRRTSAAVAGALCSRNLVVAAPAGSVSLGFSLYGMKGIPLADAVSTCARIGYQNIELALLAGYPTAPESFSRSARKTLREQISGHGLKVSSLLANLSLAGPASAQRGMLDTVRRAAELGREVATGEPPVLQTTLGGKDDTWESMRDEMAARLRAWGEAADAAGITIAIKAHVANAVNTPERLLWLHEKAGAPRIALAYDFSHFDAVGIPLEKSLRAIAPHLRFIHLKDVAANEKPVRFLLPGEGSTDYRRYFDLLRELRYSGPAVVEVSSQIFNRPGYDPIRAAETSFRVLSAALDGSSR